MLERLHIPVLKRGEVVTLRLDSLPEESEEVLEVLKAEEAPVGIWMDLALAYLRRGSPEQYVHVLQEACSKEADEFYADRFRAERVEVLCCLAATHLCKAQRLQKDTHRKSDLAMAESYCLRARNLDNREMLPFLSLGMVALARGELDTAKREFDVALSKKNRGRLNCLPYVGLAAVHFQQGQYSEALAYYKHVMELLGSQMCPADVRNGIANCYFRLGKFELAKKAFHRTLQLYPTNPEALRAIAILEIRDYKIGDQEVLETSSEHLLRAYNSDPYDPASVIMLCHLFLVQGSHDYATDLAKVACETAFQDNMKAEAVTLLARSLHATGHFSEACRFYAHARKHSDALPLPHFGLAQYYVNANEIRNAVTELENMLRAAPGSVDALKLLCQLYPHLPSKRSEKMQIIQDAGKRQHTDPHIWAVLGELMGPLDAKGSLKAYETALDLFGRLPGKPESSESPGSSRGVVPVKVINDAAVMYNRAGRYSEALELMSEALERLDGADNLGSVYPCITLKYNLARICEAGGNFTRASKIYREILSEHPKYLDAYIRLAYISHHQGSTANAFKWCRMALQQRPSDPTATVVMAGFHILHSDWHAAKDCLDSIVKKSDMNDPYALLCMGTLNISSAPAERRRDKDRDMANNHYLKALEYYQRAIDNSKQNIYAANGIGAALAEMGHLSSAREVFVRVQESAASQGNYLTIPSIWVNLANIHLAFGDYDGAIQVYENAMSKFYKPIDPTLLLYLARAHYDKGNLVDAKATLLKAQHMVPNDSSLKFNLALVMQEHGVRTLDRKHLGDDAQSVEECKKAGEDIARALRFFSALRRAVLDVSAIDNKKLTTHIQFCTDALKRSKSVREEVEARFTAAEEVREKSRVVREQAEQRHRAVEEEKRARKVKEELWKEAEAKKQFARLEQLKKGWKEQEEMRKGPKKGDASKFSRKRKMKPGAEDGAVDNDDMDYPRRDWKKKKSAGGMIHGSSPSAGDIEARRDPHSSHADLEVSNQGGFNGAKAGAIDISDDNHHLDDYNPSHHRH